MDLFIIMISVTSKLKSASETSFTRNVAYVTDQSTVMEVTL
jgi:hypothetical protein